MFASLLSRGSQVRFLSGAPFPVVLDGFLLAFPWLSSALGLAGRRIRLYLEISALLMAALPQAVQQLEPSCHDSPQARCWTRIRLGFFLEEPGEQEER